MTVCSATWREDESSSPDGCHVIFTYSDKMNKRSFLLVRGSELQSVFLGMTNRIAPSESGRKTCNKNTLKMDFMHSQIQSQSLVT